MTFYSRPLIWTVTYLSKHLFLRNHCLMEYSLYLLSSSTSSPMSSDHHQQHLVWCDIPQADLCFVYFGVAVLHRFYCIVDLRCFGWFYMQLVCYVQLAQTEASSTTRVLSSAHCTGVRLYALRIKIGTRTTSAREHSRC